MIRIVFYERGDTVDDTRYVGELMLKDGVLQTSPADLVSHIPDPVLDADGDPVSMEDEDAWAQALLDDVNNAYIWGEVVTSDADAALESGELPFLVSRERPGVEDQDEAVTTTA